jgi:hypothetical protein
VTTPRDTAQVHSLNVDDLMLVLLQEFKEVLTSLIELPPPRWHNHRIHLLSDTVSVGARLYHYP